VEEKSSTNKSHKGTWKEISFITQHKTATIIWFQEKVAGFKNLPLGKKTMLYLKHELTEAICIK
jgi:hypothetical protein